MREPYRYFKLLDSKQGTQGKVVAVESLNPAEMPDLRLAEDQGRVVCPTCKRSMVVVFSEDGMVAQHVEDDSYTDHEPEDKYLVAGKRVLQARIKELFPRAQIGMNILIPDVGRVADVVMVTASGGKLVIELQTEPLTSQQVADIIGNYAEQGIACLWVIDSRNYNPTKTPASIKKVMIGPLETALMANDQPLVYLEAQSKTLTWVHPNPQIKILAERGDKKIGKVDSLVRTYPVSQLHLRAGKWWVDHRLDARAPEVPDLPKTLQKKVDKK